MRLDPDVQDFVFRAFVSVIFVGLGLEHIFSDTLIQVLMPGWVPAQRLVSILCGGVLLTGGLSLLLGYAVRQGALMLGAFLVVVTVTVHLPGLFQIPATIPADWAWLWVVFQRSNFVKNICLLGVCIHLVGHRPGRFSLEAWRARTSKRAAAAMHPSD
jgi:uncharacterized membrane protein YphA (DoxX/SURF4 family)